MSPEPKDNTKLDPSAPATPAKRGHMAATAMSKTLRAEHNRWNMPLLTWKNGQVVAMNPCVNQ